MRSRGAMLTVSLASVALAACQPAADSDKVFGERVRAYILAHPEVLEQASENLQANQNARTAAAIRKAEANLPKLRAAIERDPRDFVANPAGKITLTQFYDYRCPHCESIAPKIVALIHANPDVRVVFKEMPIFGASSEHAAYAAFAVKKNGGDYLGLYQAFMSARPLDDAAIDRIAVSKGARAADIAPGPENTAQLANTNKLFNQLALDGTPGFVVGDQIIDGEAMDEIQAAIDKARRGNAKN